MGELGRIGTTARSGHPQSSSSSNEEMPWPFYLATAILPAMLAGAGMVPGEGPSSPPGRRRSRAIRRPRYGTRHYRFVYTTTGKTLPCRLGQTLMIAGLAETLRCAASRRDLVEFACPARSPKVAQVRLSPLVTCSQRLLRLFGLSAPNGPDTAVLLPAVILWKRSRRHQSATATGPTRRDGMQSGDGLAGVRPALVARGEFPIVSIGRPRFAAQIEPRAARWSLHTS